MFGLCASKLKYQVQCLSPEYTVLTHWSLFVTPVHLSSSPGKKPPSPLFVPDGAGVSYGGLPVGGVGAGSLKPVYVYIYVHAVTVTDVTQKYKSIRDANQVLFAPLAEYHLLTQKVLPEWREISNATVG